MEDDQFDEPLPPLAGVSPWWRLLAVIGLFAAVVLLCVVVVLVISLARQSVQNFNNVAWAGGVAPPAPAAPQAAAPDEDVPDPDNPPYPLYQNLRPAGTFPLPDDAGEADDRPAPSLRREFLKGGDGKAPLWSSTDPDATDCVLVSPDGQNMAYTWGHVLLAGPLGKPDLIDDNGPVPPNGGAPGIFVGPARRAAWGRMQPAAVPPPRPRGGDYPHARLSGWSADGTRVVWSSAGGLILVYLPRAGRQEAAQLRAEAALPLPLGPGVVGRQPYVAVRLREQAKADGSAGDAGRDRHELVMVDGPGDPAGLPRVLLGAAVNMQSLALSPDGKRVAVAAGIAAHDGKPARRRVVVFNPDNGEALASSPEAAHYAGVCWTPDGKALVYARSQSPAPADHAPGTPADTCDLWLFDLATKKETRLSRGGGFLSPSVTDDGDLFFLDRTGAGLALDQMPLQKAREFAEAREQQQADKLKAWAELAEGVWKKAGLGAEPEKVALTADLIGKVAAAYREVYGKLMAGAEPPGATVAGLDRQRREVAGLDLAPAARARLGLILGAVESRCPALAPGAVAWGRGSPAAHVSAENPFAVAFNPFRSLKPGDWQPLAEALYRAEGRRLVLTNDPAAAQEQVKKLADAELARGTDLLKQNKGDEADRALLEVVKRHERNHELVVRVGTLLYEHGRTKALAELLQPLLEQLDIKGAALPRDARLYNLMGIAVLESDPTKAITAFGSALRCDLGFGPAYLNLAQANALANRPRDARLCLRRYLALFPKGEWAEDARRRLAITGGENNAAPPVAR